MTPGCLVCGERTHDLRATARMAARAERRGDPLQPLLAEIRRLKTELRACAASGHAIPAQHSHNGAMATAAAYKT